MHSDPESIAAGTVLGGLYRLDGLIGKGGFGAVFRATRIDGGGVAAVKVLSRDVLEQSGGLGRFQREADLASRLRHPNTVRVLGAGEDARGWLFIAFELLDGRSVEEELASRGAMPAQRVAAIAADALAALEEAHAMGIVHRDLKPANIFLARTPEGDRVKVLDFGIAKSTNPGTLAGLTQMGAAMGTPIYMAPEQLLGKPVSPASDIFAMGIVLADMALAVSPYGADPQLLSVITDRIDGKPVPIPPPLAGTPLGDIVARATAPDPAKRFGSAAEMRSALLALAPTATGLRAIPAALAATVNLDTPFTSAPTQVGEAASSSAPAKRESWSEPPPTVRQSAPSDIASPPAPRRESAPAVAQRATAPGPRRRSNLGLWFLVVGFLMLATAVGLAAYSRVGPFANLLGSSKPKRPRPAHDAPPSSPASAAPTSEASTSSASTAAPTSAPAPGTSSSADGESAITIVPCPAIDETKLPDLGEHLHEDFAPRAAPSRFCSGEPMRGAETDRCEGFEGRGFLTRRGPVSLYLVERPEAREAIERALRAAGGQRTILEGQKHVADLRLPSEDAKQLAGELCRASP